jgi:hypothetical protein
MNESEKLSSELHDIKQMMERSSRFISLSGLSGISAGICALIGAWLGSETIESYGLSVTRLRRSIEDSDSLTHVYSLYSRLFQIALITFAAALVSAFIFTYRRSIKTNVPIWGVTAQRLLINVTVPMIAGGIFLVSLIQNGIFGFVAPGCLIFYGLGVLNASKYTLPETRYLGYAEIILGLFNLYFLGDGLYFWAAGFGVMHILYGAFMWWKYERN